MATSKISTLGLEVRGIGVGQPSISGGGSWSTNFSSMVEADLPSGKHFLAITGFTTNNVNLVFTALKARSGTYDIQVRNLSSSTQSANVQVWYLCAYEGIG